MIWGPRSGHIERVALFTELRSQAGDPLSPRCASPGVDEERCPANIRPPWHRRKFFATRVCRESAEFPQGVVDFLFFFLGWALGVSQLLLRLQIRPTSEARTHGIGDDRIPSARAGYADGPLFETPQIREEPAPAGLAAHEMLLRTSFLREECKQLQRNDRGTLEEEFDRRRVRQRVARHRFEILKILLEPGG